MTELLDDHQDLDQPDPPRPEQPITATPKLVTAELRITYEGKLRMTETTFPLLIEIPAPRPGLYTYTVTIESDPNPGPT